VGVELLPSVLSTGWASGVNAYAAVLVLGLIGRFGQVAAIPPVLGSPWVLALSALLFLVEMVADKIPYVDSIWDSVHTIVRPVVGALLGYALGKDAGTVEAIMATLGGGATALASHGVKSMSRVAINTSPEPVSNMIVSTGEDVATVGLLALAIANPIAAVLIALILVLASLWLIVAARRVVRRVLNRS